MDLTKTQILEKKLSYPHNLLKLIPTHHFISRLGERGLGVNVIPTLVRITENNIHSGRTKDGINLSSVVIKIEYTRRQNMFLALNPKDGALKTLWFRERRNNGDRRRRERNAVENTQSAI